ACQSGGGPAGDHPAESSRRVVTARPVWPAREPGGVAYFRHRESIESTSQSRSGARGTDGEQKPCSSHKPVSRNVPRKPCERSLRSQRSQVRILPSALLQVP